MRDRGLFLLVLPVAVLLLLLSFRHRAGAGGARQSSESSPAGALKAASGSDCVTPPPAARDDDRRPLWHYASPADKAALDAALPAPATSIHYVRIDRQLVEGKESPFWATRGGVVDLPLPDGTTLRVVIDTSEIFGANRFTSVGHVLDIDGSRAVFAYNEGFLSATIETDRQAYALRPANDEMTQFYAVKPTRLPGCGGVRRMQPDAILMAEARARASSSLGGNPAPPTDLAAAAESPRRPEIHLMVLYTQAVKPTMTGAARVAALQSEFDAATAKVNGDLSASQIPASIKLVRVAETNYDESRSGASDVQDEALIALAKPADGRMDEIHAWRDAAGADIVCLALNRTDVASIGLSYVLASPSTVDTTGAAFNPMQAFAVVQYSTIAGTDVLPHEIGHLFGCAHARGDPGATGSNDGAYAYSYGYRVFGQDGRQYHDIMAYSPGLPLGYYSSPKVIASPPANVPLGVPAGLPGEADCARTIAQTAFEVSSYRLQKSAAPTGTLVNVSTRAYVGTGDAVLIAGFVIEGAAPKRVLVRAAGPALKAFGVADALADPRLRVFRGTSALVENDDWWRSDDAAALAVAAGAVGAFPFDSGSADSAVIVRLNPGLYSAVVEGAGNSSGSGLVEAYDVDRSGNRIVNLSTRAFADKGRPMFGGFVVDGAPGTTKRILVRVLGPTLARSYGVKDAMDDPMFELHAATGELLVANDDWSTGTSAGAISPENDFVPKVSTYSEHQIAATGFAPTNRREPCLMLDLAPGSYSVIARPFERLTGSTPQPAQPGVAIVEVYEIVP